MPQVSNLMLNQYLGLLPATYWAKAKMPFVYDVPILPAAATVATTAQLQISSDSDFALYLQTMAVFLTADHVTAVASPPFTITIQDAGSGRLWSNSAVHLTNWFGTAQMPYVYVKPLLLGGGSILTFTVANLTAVAHDIRLSLHGIKLFDYPEQ